MGDFSYSWGGYQIDLKKKNSKDGAAVNKIKIPVKILWVEFTWASSDLNQSNRKCKALISQITAIITSHVVWLQVVKGGTETALF